MARYVLALDQGTTSSRAILYDREGRAVAQGQQGVRQIYPWPGWVEHDPRELVESQLSSAREALRRAGAGPRDVAAIGITNQRETAIVWDRRTGAPLGNAIVWQCRRTAPLCEELRAGGWEAPIRDRTGLPLDAYFSASKLRWLLESVPGAAERAAGGDLLFGTVDSWLVWNLTGGAVHATDPTNASRTMLYNIHESRWDDELLGLFGAPRAMLPEVRPTRGSFGIARHEGLRVEAPIVAVAGDQQAALFGQLCFGEGAAKNTYGTGCFALMHTGSRPIASRHGLLTTIAWDLGDGPAYALEGSVFVGGAAVQWLRDELRLIATAAESEALARSVPDTCGAYLVPAFVGLGAPHWDMTARGALVGLTRGVRREHVVRACLESIAYQTADVLGAMAADSGVALEGLRVDGGASANDFLLGFQADILGIPVTRPDDIETTARGVAYLAGLAVGFWASREELPQRAEASRRFEPSMAPSERERLLAGWARAVEKARAWER